jgi:hypothetical protein
MYVILMPICWKGQHKLEIISESNFSLLVLHIIRELIFQVTSGIVGNDYLRLEIKSNPLA